MTKRFRSSVCVVSSGRCQALCLRNAEKPGDRWSHIACSACCMHDKDGDNFLTENDITLSYELQCGEDADVEGSECQCSEQQERFIPTV